LGTDRLKPELQREVSDRTGYNGHRAESTTFDDYESFMSPPQILFQAKRFRVERVTHVSPDGTQHAKDIVRHPGAVAIVPLLDDGRICLVENYRAAVQERLVELPAGTLEPPEEPVKTALRELAEETGFRAAHIEHLTTLCMSPGILDEKMYVYLATGLSAGQTSLEPGEDIRVVCLTWDEVLKMVRDGTIRDAKSVAALLYYEVYRR
jgi:ADP-ribose pyrophosphatase